jgi:8-oxo-dGTP diphosphatase
MPPKVVLALIEKDGEFLLIDRRNPHLKLTWAFPGGIMEEGEEEEVAAVREAREEVGLDVEVVKKLSERKHPNTFVQLSYFHCQLKDKNQEPKILETEEIKDIKWVKASEAIDYFTSDVDPNIKKFLESFK